MGRCEGGEAGVLGQSREGACLMEQDWAKEPWELDETPSHAWINSEGERIPIHSPWIVDAFEDEPSKATANMKRIIACVNACAGVPTEILPELTSLLKRFILWLEPIQKVSIKEPPDADPAA